MEIKKTIESFNDVLRLQQLKDLCDAIIEDNYDNKWCFFLHDKTDNYNYVVKDENNNDVFVHFLGAEAYRKFIETEEAKSIYRYDKNVLYMVGVNRDDRLELLLSK